MESSTRGLDRRSVLDLDLRRELPLRFRIAGWDFDGDTTWFMLPMFILRRFSLVFAGLAILILSGPVVCGRGIGSVAFRGLARLGSCGGAEAAGGGGVACKFMVRGL